MISDTALESIRKRVESASPGPWAVLRHIPSVIAVGNENLPLVCAVRYSDNPAMREEQGIANAAFIFNARQDIPALLAEVDRLKKELSNRVNTRFVGQLEPKIFLEDDESEAGKIVGEK